MNNHPVSGQTILRKGAGHLSPVYFLCHCVKHPHDRTETINGVFSLCTSQFVNPLMIISEIDSFLAYYAQCIRQQGHTFMRNGSARSPVKYHVTGCPFIRQELQVQPKQTSCSKFSKLFQSKPGKWTLTRHSTWAWPDAIAISYTNAHDMTAKYLAMSFKLKSYQYSYMQLLQW